MTLTIENPSDRKGTGNSGTPSQNSGPSPRSNPVCLEVGVTIRSLPGEMGTLSQQVREEARTVIVFDNGAVVRSTSNLPLEQKVILSNSAGRDIVCRVAAGRNMPNLRGYVELEFLEPVNDFWNLHQSATSSAGSAPGSLSPAQAEIAAYAAPPSVPAAPRAASTPEIPAKQTAKPAETAPADGSGPSFDDIPGLISMPVSAAATERKPATELQDREANSKNRTAAPANAVRPAAASRRNAPVESQVNARDASSDSDILSIHTPAQAPSRDFMSKGLMAYEQTPAAAESNSRKPLIIGIAAVVLVAVGAVAYFKGQGASSEPTMNMSALTRPINPTSAAAPTTTPAVPSVPASLEPAPADTQAQTPPEPVSVEPAQPSARTLSPAIVSNAGTVDSHAEAQNSRRPEKGVAASKPAEPAAVRRPAIPNLKMNTPSAPNANLSNASEIAAPEAAASATSAGLLTASGRASNPPVAPPSAPALVAPAPVVPAPPAAKVIHAPTLITSARPDYPATAKASRVQGDVSVLAEIDANGKVIGARALSGPLLLRQAAVDSVRQWKYSPGTTDGKPSPSQVTVNITFRMN